MARFLSWAIPALSSVPGSIKSISPPLMNKSHGYALLPAALLLCVQAWAGSAGLMGEPPHTRFRYQLNVFPEDFAVAEDSDSIVYVGNYDGVMTFDGERWRLITLPNHELVRSLAYDGHDRVYVGGYDDFGYIDHDDAGRAVFHDLLPAFKSVINKPRFQDIWSVDVSPAGVFFVALKAVYLYNPADGKVKAWHYPGRFGAIVNDHGRVILQFRGEGLKMYHDGKWHLMPGTSGMKHLVYNFVPFASGALLALSVDGRWRVYKDGKVSPFHVPAGMPASSHFYAGVGLRDRTMALAADNGTLYFLSADGKSVRKVHLGDGALADVIKANDGGLLVAGDQALFHVQWPTAWTVIKEGDGLSGLLSHAVRWDGRWYVLSGAGVFRASRGAPVHFTHLAWTRHGAWDLLPLDASHALLADSYAVIEIDHGAARAITGRHLYPRILLRSRFDKDRVYVGTDSGLAVLVRKAGRWHLASNDGGMNGLEVNSLVESGPRTVWVGSGRGGVRRIHLGNDGRRITAQQKFGKADGLDYGSGPHGGDVIRFPGNRIVVTTRAGEFLWTGRRFKRFSVYGLDALREPNEFFTLSVKGHDLWACSDRHVYHHTGHPAHWVSEPIGRLQHGVVQGLEFLRNGGAMLVTTNALLHYTPLAGDPDTRPPRVILRSVRLTRSDGERVYLPLHRSKPLRLPAGAFSLAFRFALPDYQRQHGAMYEARLKGVETRFSSWAPNSVYTYSQLDAGSYQYQLKGRDSQGRITEIRPFSFRILPPWYATVWARALWGFLLAVAGAMLAIWYVRYRTRHLAAEKALLEATVKARTDELRAANKRLQAMVHMDSLTEIPNRRRLDDYLNQVWDHCGSGRRFLSVLVIDVDHFKTYNDRHGHLAGDKLLQQLVGILSGCLRRAEDLLARYGGEEFLAILPGAASDMAYELGERMRCAVESGDLGVTISVGVATCVPSQAITATMLVHEADEALYKAKSEGRNHTVVSPGFEPERAT